MHHWWEVVTCHAKHVCFAILHLWELTSTENQKPLFSKFPVLVNCISCGNLLNAVIVVLTNYFLLWFIWNAWGRPIRQQCRHETTCWWLGNVLMASSRSWVTVLNSRTGIPAARSCFVRLNTQALAASWTFRVAGWFFIPKTTSYKKTWEEGSNILLMLRDRWGSVQKWSGGVGLWNNIL